MKASEEMLSYTLPPEDRGYYELSSAIVTMAVSDYRKARKKTKNQEEIEDLRIFFMSDVFESISGVDNPSIFMQRLDEQIEKEIRHGIKGKRAKQIMKCNG